jgi:hypothetical protein
MDAIHSMILDDQRISAKRTADTLVISRERVGYIIRQKRDLSACFTSHFGPISVGFFFNCFINMEEITWICIYDQEAKQQSKE